jgi:hypothetical protein
MRPVPARHHGTTAFHRGLEAPHSRYHASGKFGRLFPTLPPLALPGVDDDGLRDRLRRLGADSESPMFPGSDADDPDNSKIPVGFVFFGQFVDHDITLDTTSSLERQNDPEGIANFRTPLLELDSVYGSGPDVTPHFYQGGGKLLVDEEFGRPQLPRTSTRTAVIGDPRNDENLIISQLQLLFLRFHNRVVDALAARGFTGGRLFREAQRIVRWHYQWVVLREFLPLTVGKDVVKEIFKGDCCSTGRCFYNWRHEPFIPVEFAVAAYRFGHSQIPGRFQVNDEFVVDGSPKVPLFDPAQVGKEDPDDLSGFGSRGARRFVDWRYLFATGDGDEQPSKRIDPVLSPPLFHLPFIADPGPDNPDSLAARNLLRGHAFGLPSGQAVARAMCLDPLSPGDLDEVADFGFEEHTPLFYYLLREAEVAEQGRRLGPVGARIVAEVLIGLLEGDRMSFVRAYPKWTPEVEDLGTTSDFGMADLVAFVG